MKVTKFKNAHKDSKREIVKQFVGGLLPNRDKPQAPQIITGTWRKNLSKLASLNKKAK